MHLFTNDRRKWGWGALLAALLFMTARWLGPQIPPNASRWLPLAGEGLFGLWLLLLNLLWFLGDASTRRSGLGWLCGTPVIVGLTGLWVGGMFDTGCIIQWGPLGGSVGLVAGFVLGWVMGLAGRGSEEADRPLLAMSQRRAILLGVVSVIVLLTLPDFLMDDGPFSWAGLVCGLLSSAFGALVAMRVSARTIWRQPAGRRAFWLLFPLMMGGLLGLALFLVCDQLYLLAN